jgi:hypothetical protein
MEKKLITEQPAKLTSSQMSRPELAINPNDVFLSLPGAVGTAISGNPKAEHAFDALLEGYEAHRTGKPLDERHASGESARELAENGARQLVKELGASQGNEIIRQVKASVDQAIKAAQGATR